MPATDNALLDFLDKVPPPDEVRQKIAENIRQGKLWCQLLCIAEQRKSVEEVSGARSANSGGRAMRTPRNQAGPHRAQPPAQPIDPESATRFEP